MWLNGSQRSEWMEKLCMIIATARLGCFAYDMLRLYCTQPWETIE